MGSGRMGASAWQTSPEAGRIKMRRWVEGRPNWSAGERASGWDRGSGLPRIDRERIGNASGDPENEAPGCEPGS